MDKILSMIRLGYSIKFYREVGQLKIEVNKKVSAGHERYSNYHIEQMLPLDDNHFNENRITDCLQYCENYISKKVQDDRFGA